MSGFLAFSSKNINTPNKYICNMINCNTRNGILNKLSSINNLKKVTVKITNVFPLVIYILQNPEISFCFFALFCLMSVSSTGPPHCQFPVTTISVKNFEDKYHLLSNRSTTSLNPRRLFGSTMGRKHAGNKWCPWKWVVQRDTNRVPEAIVYAECRGCDLAVCRKIEIYHYFLVWSPTCDSKTKDAHRIWSSVRLPIAYIYTGSKTAAATGK